jgi:hypothetical protein
MTTACLMGDRVFRSPPCSDAALNEDVEREVETDVVAVPGGPFSPPEEPHPTAVNDAARSQRPLRVRMCETSLKTRVVS